MSKKIIEATTRIKKFWNKVFAIALTVLPLSIIALIWGFPHSFKFTSTAVVIIFFSALSYKIFDIVEENEKQEGSNHA